MTRVAVIQTGSVCFDKQESIKKVLFWIEKAAREQTQLILFPEAFIPCYPRGINFGTRIGSRSPEGKDLWARYYQQSVDLSGEDLKPIAKSARENKLFISLGIIEKDAGTLYCTQVMFTPKGLMAGKHRKIKPTGSERIIWGEGDGSSLTTFDTPLGIIGTLICWENYMPLARMALYLKGVNIYLAPTADQRESWQTSVKHIATEGRCFVLTANQLIRYEDYPPEVIKSEQITPEQSTCRG
jgi:nitrilase